MRHTYDDIIKRIKEEPKWWDENGCPRYDDFHPKLCSNIYARNAGLFRIACQDCHKKFMVAMTGGVFDIENNPKKWHYGDPPAHDCAGDTMNCDDLDLVEWWVRAESYVLEWERKKEFEGMIE